MAALYCLTGWLGLLLAIPPGYATAVWPPSGIALAGVLLLGNRVSPGIWLGSFSINLLTVLEGEKGVSTPQLALPMVIASGATLQALAGALLIRRFVGFPHPLYREQDIGKFLILGGPISCLIGATIAVTGMAAGGYIPGSQMLTNWGTWWAGDTIGVFILTPLILTWAAEPGSAWRMRRLSVGGPLLAAFGASVVLFIRARGWEQEQAWTLLTIAMLFTSLLGAFLLVITGRTAAINELAAQRTDALSQAQAIHARLRLTVDTALEAIVTMDDGGLITDWNTRAEKMFGWSSAEAIGRCLSDTIIPPQYRDKHPIGLRRFLETGKTTLLNRRVEVTALRRDGSEFPVELSVSPAKVDGKYIFSGFIKDITERKRIERELQRVNAELEERSNEMEQLLCAVSHDLKSPLVTIQGYTGHLRKDLDRGRPQDLTAYCDRIERATQHMHQLIDDLLKLSRVGQVEHATEPVDVGAIVQQLLAGHAMELAERNAKVTVADAMPVLRLDMVRTTQVLDNLLVNALMHAGGRGPLCINVGVEETEDEIRLFVRDNGPGIAHCYHAKIFEQFQRLDTRVPGTGLGLAIVKRAVESQGGRVWVESTPGHGATFWVGFPRQAKGYALP